MKVLIHNKIECSDCGSNSGLLKAEIEGQKGTYTICSDCVEKREDETTLNDFLDDYTNFTYEEIEDEYKTYLDEAYEPVKLAGMTIYASDMKDIDPVMFRCSVADFSSEEYEEHEGKYYKKEDFETAENDFNEYIEELNETED